MEAKNGDQWLNECQIAWLTVEKDLNAKLQTPESLKYALQCSGRNPSEKAINQYWSKFEGSISFDQFSAIMHSEKRTTMADLMKAFRKIDLNGDGFITHDELYKTLTKRGEKLTHEEVQAIIDEADYNKDGKLDYAEFCHILLSTATECQSLSNKKASRTLNKTVHTSSSMKKKTSTPYSDTNGVLTSSQMDRPQDDKLSLSSKARVQQQLMKSSHQRDSMSNDFAVKKHSKSTSDRASGDHSNVTTTTSHSGPVSKSLQAVHNGTSSVEDPTEMSAGEDVKLKNKVSAPDSESDKEVEEELDESSNLGDSILQQLPISSTPATDRTTTTATTNKPVQKTSQLFGSKLPPIGKSTLPPLTCTLSQPTTDIPPITTSAAVNSSTTTITQSTTTSSSSSIEVSSAADTQAPTARKTSLVHQEGSSDVTKVVKNGEEGVGDDKESSRDGLVTVTPLNHTLSSELSGTLSDDSVAVTPTESIDISEDTEDNQNNKTVQELPASEQAIQPDHLQQQEEKKTSIATTTEFRTVTSTTSTTATVEQVAETNKKQSPTSAVYQKPPKVPSDLESWCTISGKGCFYIKKLEGSHISDELTYHLVSQQYGLHLPQPSCVFVEIQVVPPGDELLDVALFLFKSDPTNEIATDFITFTEHQINKKFVCKLDLEAGNYIMVPFTGGCRLKPCDDDDDGSHDPVSLLSPDSSKLTEQSVKVLTEIFHRIDLDDNGFISRQEFDLFQEHTSEEVCDDDAWQVIQDNFDQNSDNEITIKGFLDLHLMTAQDTSGGKEAELLIILQSMGYNKQLILDEACPFSLDVHTDMCEGEIIVMETQPFTQLVNPVLCQLALMRGVASPVRGGADDQVILYTYTSLYHATIVIENKTGKKVSVQLDCSGSTNFLYNRECCVQVLEVHANSSVLGFHLMPENCKEDWKPMCLAELILTK